MERLGETHLAVDGLFPQNPRGVDSPQTDVVEPMFAQVPDVSFAVFLPGADSLIVADWHDVIKAAKMCQGNGLKTSGR